MEVLVSGQKNDKIDYSREERLNCACCSARVYVIDELADAEDGIGDYPPRQFKMLIAKQADISLHVIVGTKDFIDGRSVNIMDNQ